MICLYHFLGFLTYDQVDGYYFYNILFSFCWEKKTWMGNAMIKVTNVIELNSGPIKSNDRS